MLDVEGELLLLIVIERAAGEDCEIPDELELAPVFAPAELVAVKGLELEVELDVEFDVEVDVELDDEELFVETALVFELVFIVELEKLWGIAPDGSVELM